MAMLSAGYVLLILIALLVLIFLCIGYCDRRLDDRADQPVESAEQRLARALAEWAALVAIAQAVLAARAEATVAGQAAPAVPLPLPYFPYAADQGGKPSDTVECAICLEPLLPRQLCSEVPPCRHVFHSDCLGKWARSNGSCPLCRAKIVPGSDEVAIADDMV